MLKETIVALSVVTLAGSATALPTAAAKAADTSVQIAACNPCNPCNPCSTKACNPCNPCGAACNPCKPASN